MTSTKIASFTQAAQQAQQWVNELSAKLHWSEPRAFHLLKAVLHALRDWLSPEEVADLSAQLPTLIRGIFFEGWNPSQPATERSKYDFVIRVEKQLGFDNDTDIEDAIATVFYVLDQHISHGEIVQVRNALKKSIRELWPAT